MEPMSWMDYNHPGWHWYQVISWKISRRIIISPSREGSAIIYRDVFDIDIGSLCKSESRIDYDAVSTVTGPCAQSAWSAKVMKKKEPVMPIKGCHLMVRGFKNLKASHILKWLFCRKEIVFLESFSPKHFAEERLTQIYIPFSWFVPTSNQCLLLASKTRS